MLLQHVMLLQLLLLGVVVAIGRMRLRLQLATCARLVEIVGRLGQGSVHRGHRLATAADVVAAAAARLGPSWRMAVAEATASMRQGGRHAGASKSALL